MAIEVVNQVARLIVTGSKNANADREISVTQRTSNVFFIRDITTGHIIAKARRFRRAFASFRSQMLYHLVGQQRKEEGPGGQQARRMEPTTPEGGWSAAE